MSLYSHLLWTETFTFIDWPHRQHDQTVAISAYVTAGRWRSSPSATEPGKDIAGADPENSPAPARVLPHCLPAPSGGTHSSTFALRLKMRCSTRVWTWLCHESLANYCSSLSFWQFYFQYIYSSKSSSNFTARELSPNPSSALYILHLIFLPIVGFFCIYLPVWAPLGQN